jgi:hypothetical protein
MLINHKEDKFSRFKEFDEARVYIETFNKDSFDAIDYMIDHKEFYFLLKNILKNLPKKEFVEYIFLRLPCLKRKDNIEMLKNIYPKYPEIIYIYLQKCPDLK